MSFHNVPTCPGLSAELAIRFDGTNWVDVTDYLRSFATSISRSRALGVFPPGSASFTLDNRDGRFTPLNGSSPYAGGIYPGRHIRYKEKFAATEYDVWYGIVEDWGDSYPQARDGIATVTSKQLSALLARYKASPLSAEAGENETAGDRIDRVLTAAGYTFTTALATGVVPLQGTTLSGDALSEIESAVRAELGALWCEPSGVLTFEDRYALLTSSRSSSVQATFGPADVRYVGEPPLSSGLDLVVNQATAGNVGQSATTSTNASSISTLGGVYGAMNDTSLIGTDPHFAAGNAEALVRLYGTPSQHPTSITLVPAGAPSSCWPQALGRRIRDKVTVKVPTPWGATLSSDVWIVGISHSGSPQDGRTTTFDFEPAANYAGLTLFTLDSSALDGSHILGW